MINQKPMMRKTRRESLRFNLGYHIRDYHSTMKYETTAQAEPFADQIRKRLEQLGGLAARW
jgi:hypothetical protein